MSKITLYCHRKINSFMCICGYAETYHTCDHVIDGAITIHSCPDNCKVCQEEIDKRKYYDYRWQESEGGCTSCEICSEKLGCRVICEVCFCIRCKKEKETYSSCED